MSNTSYDASAALTDARTRLAAVRAQVDSTAPPFAQIATAYTRISNNLAGAQNRAAARAAAGGLGVRSTLAIADVQSSVLLSQLASREVPLLLAARFSEGPDATSIKRDWIAAWGGFRNVAGKAQTDMRAIDANGLTSTSVQETWTTALTTPAAIRLEDALDAEILDQPRAMMPLEAFMGLGELSTARNEAINVVLQQAVGEAMRFSEQEIAIAQLQKRQLSTAGVAAFFTALLIAFVVTNWLRRCLKNLATVAHRISHGELMVPSLIGPREVRAVAAALTDSVNGLRRMHSQTTLVVAGDYQSALQVEALPGELGRAVHASLRQVVTATHDLEVVRAQLAHQASHDALTGLINRAEILRRLTTGLQSGTAGAAIAGVLFIDLDGFKAVNDTHGHAAGDQLLRLVAQRLTSISGAEHVAGRLGGDEFVILPAGPAAQSPSTGDELGGTEASNRQVLTFLGQRVVASLSQPFALTAAASTSGEEVHEPVDATVLNVTIGASVGVAPVGHILSDAEALLAAADAAVYRAKAGGRGRVECFDEMMLSAQEAEKALKDSLRLGMSRGELRLHYQPTVSLASGGVQSYEALVRWQHPELGLLSAEAFIPEAEKSSLISELGAWVLMEATRQLAVWDHNIVMGAANFKAPASGAPESSGYLAVSVNLSGRHLADPRVLTDVSRALEASGIAPQRLVVEVTETVLVDHPRAAQHLQGLRGMGVKVAIDDFGTGFTSIGALAATPADIIKVSPSFATATDPRHQHLSHLIVAAAQAFGLRVSAEGVETDEQLKLVTDNGYEAAQGWAINPPLPPQQLPSHLLDRAITGRHTD